jgi:succinate dehydrogenase / fumarate reductase membrane anchor subunit
MSAAMWWYLQRITGAALAVLLIVHFWVEHFVSENLRRGDLTYDAIRARITNPAWQAIDIAFLLIALLHGLSGARNIILDYSRIGRRGARFATAGIIVIGFVWAWWGIAAFTNIK